MPLLSTTPPAGTPDASQCGWGSGCRHVSHHQRHVAWRRAGPSHDLGADFYLSRTDTERRKRNHIRQLEALGYHVTLDLAA